MKIIKIREEDLMNKNKHYEDAALSQLTYGVYGARGQVSLYSNINARKSQVKQCYSKLIKKVIFNEPATIVFWSDGTKTVVKCGKDDIWDPEKGLAMAVAKKFFGNEGFYYDIFKKWIPEEKQMKTIVYNGRSLMNILLGDKKEEESK